MRPCPSLGVFQPRKITTPTPSKSDKPCASTWLSPNMTDGEEAAEPVKAPSRRDRLKGVLGRTKTKLRRKDNDRLADDEVEEFLTAGRNSTSSTGRPSVSDSLSFADDPPPSDRPPPSDSSNSIRTTQVPYPDTFVPHPHQSPRRLIVPRIDVSASQRYPGAQPLHVQPERSSDDFLRPQYQARSQSVSSLSKGRGRARGLSVTFTEGPPAVIGEGGDEAQAPPIEVSKARTRARSVSPTPTPRSTGPIAKMWGMSVVKRKPVPEQTISPVIEETGYISPGLQRGQTNFSSPTDGRPLNREFEMSLGLGSASTNSAGSNQSPPVPVLHAPRPVHPPVAVPPVREIPVLRELKPSYGADDLQGRFEEEKSQSQNPFADPPASAPNRFYSQAQSEGQSLPLRQTLEKRGRSGQPQNRNT